MAYFVLQFRRHLCHVASCGKNTIMHLCSRMYTKYKYIGNHKSSCWNIHKERVFHVLEYLARRFPTWGTLCSIKLQQPVKPITQGGSTAIIPHLFLIALTALKIFSRDLLT